MRGEESESSGAHSSPSRGQQHLATFLAHLEGNDQAGRLPAFVRRELEAYPPSWWRAPLLGEHNAEVYGALLGYGTAELDALRRDGAI